MADLMRDTFTEDPGNFGGGRRSGDQGVGVEFYYHKVAEKDYCRMVFPGDRQTVWDQPVREEDKKRFPNEWRLFQESKEQTEGQTLLEMWGVPDKGSIEIYKVFNIRTVEQLAALPDVHINGLPPGAVQLAHRHRVMAREYLEEKKQSQGFDQAIEAARQSQALAKNAMAKNADLERELAELKERLEKKPVNGAKPDNKPSFPKLHKLAGRKTTYELSDGQIVEGKGAAIEAQRLIDESA